MAIMLDPALHVPHGREAPARAHIVVLAIAATTLLTMLPALLRGPMVHDSFWIDTVWADGFYRALTQGVPYPRWLLESHGGLGAPVFYFYAPLAFYGAAFFQALGASAYGAVIATFAAGMAASGASMYLWLREQSRRPLLGAILFMILPYHLCDFYKRGALAEFIAIAVLPLVALGVKRAGEGRGFTLLAISYAALICAHLPSALLVSVLLLAPYSVQLAATRGARLPPIAAGLFAGILLSSIYLVPALSLQDHISVEHLWRHRHYQIETWNFLTPWRWSSPAMPLLFIPIVLFSSVVAIALMKRGRNGWALYSIVIGLIVAGLVPGVWSLPLMAKVQFPWRANILIEFALVTAIARSTFSVRQVVMVCAPLLTLSAVQLMNGRAQPEHLRTAAARQADVPEYLPPGAPAENYPFSEWALKVAQERRGTDPVTGLEARFYFPAWQVSCQGRPVRAYPEAGTGLLAVQGRDCEARLETLPAERVGMLAALLGVLMLGLTSLAALVQRRRASA